MCQAVLKKKMTSALTLKLLQLSVHLIIEVTAGLGLGKTVSEHEVSRAGEKRWESDWE